MEKIVLKIGEYLAKYVNKHWIALAVGLGAVVLVFLITMIIAMTSGDFIRFRGACKLIANGDTEKGMEKLRGGTKELIADKPAALNYEKIVTAPYGYSAMRAFKKTVFFATIVFSLVAGMLSTIIDIIFSTQAAANVVVVALVGSLLTVLACIISRAFQKGATKRFYKMSEVINERIILGEPAAETDALLPSTILLWEKINEASEKKDNSFEDLNQLYSLLKQESKKPQSDANRDKLKEASALLNGIILPQS